ncbi:hypothetical protein D3C76_1364870 [compost metagenome]
MLADVDLSEAAAGRAKLREGIWAGTAGLGAPAVHVRADDQQFRDACLAVGALALCRCGGAGQSGHDRHRHWSGAHDVSAARSVERRDRSKHRHPVVRICRGLYLRDRAGVERLCADLSVQAGFAHGAAL